MNDRQKYRYQELRHAMNRVFAQLDKQHFTCIRRPHPDPQWYIVDVVYDGVEIGWLELPPSYSPLFTHLIGLGINSSIAHDPILSEKYGKIFNTAIVEPLLRQEQQLEADRRSVSEMIATGEIQCSPEELAELVSQGLIDPPGKARQRCTSPKQWEQIEDHRWNRDAVRLLHEGYSYAEIGRRLDPPKVAKTVQNRLAELRKAYGETIVPMRRK